ncbi:hypothetical protein E4U15_000285 [Claviceps sp. LM218 group G6]|nr:hypothetical protein E4U15_000285 [Claviceps sp. LM218 group G6]
MLSAWRYDAHTKEVPVSRSYDAPRGRSSKVQACMPCREKKTRCSGDATSQRPCSRCRLKSLPCQYAVSAIKKHQSRRRVLGRVPVKKSYVERVEEGKQGSEGGRESAMGLCCEDGWSWSKNIGSTSESWKTCASGENGVPELEMPRPVIGDEIYAMFDPLVRGDEIAWKEQRGRDICAEGGTWKEDWNGDENGCGHVNGVQYGYTSVGDAMAAESMLARTDAEPWRVEEGALQNGFHKGVCEQTGWLVD